MQPASSVPAPSSTSTPPPPIPPAPHSSSAELEAILAGINSIGGPPPLPPPVSYDSSASSPSPHPATLLDSMPHPPPGSSSPVTYVSSYPPPLAPRPKVPQVHFTGSSMQSTTAPSTHSLLSPSTHFASPSSSNSVDLSAFPTSDLRKELEALKRKVSPTARPPSPVHPLHSCRPPLTSLHLYSSLCTAEQCRHSLGISTAVRQSNGRALQ